MIALRSMSFGGKASIPTARDYVQDGLVAIWDAHENDGWGNFNSDVGNKWADLVGGNIIRGWGWNDTCGWFNNTFNPLNRVDFGTIKLDFSNGLTCECCSSNFENSNSRIQCTAVIGGNGLSDDTQQINICGNSSGWVRNVTGFKSYLEYVLSKPCTQTALIGTDGKIDFRADGNHVSVDIPKSSYTVPSGLTAKMTFHTLSRSSTVGDGTFHCARIYNRILTSSEIAANYAVDRERFSLA